jgi:hypothetical protein
VPRLAAHAPARGLAGREPHPWYPGMTGHRASTADPRGRTAGHHPPRLGADDSAEAALAVEVVAALLPHDSYVWSSLWG